MTIVNDMPLKNVVLLMIGSSAKVTKSLFMHNLFNNNYHS